MASDALLQEPRTTTPGDGASRSWSVGGIGSCRIYKPLRRAVNAGMLGAFKHVFPHVHNPVEILQALDALRGKRRLPPELFRWLNVKKDIFGKGVNHLGATVAASDVFVIELSSVRLSSFREWELQINTFRENLAEEGVPVALISELYRDDADQAAVKAEITALLSDVTSREIVAEARFSEMEEEAIVDYVARLRDVFDVPVMFVGTVQVTQTGDQIAQRIKLNRAMADYAAGQSDVDFFNPTDLVEEYGFAKVMKDLGHYNDGFERTAGLALAARIDALLTTAAR